MVKNELDAQDLLQNSFLDIFLKLDSFKYQSSVGAWMKKIVINNCINYLKKRKLLFEDIIDDNHFQPDFEEIDQDQILLNIRAIKEALMELPDGYRVVFSLYAIEGYDHKEISSILKISETTSKSQYSRARRKIKELIIQKRACHERK